jgi:hypothetical protein
VRGSAFTGGAHAGRSLRPFTGAARGMSSSPAGPHAAGAMAFFRFGDLSTSSTQPGATGRERKRGRVPEELESSSTWGRRALGRSIAHTVVGAVEGEGRSVRGSLGRGRAVNTGNAAAPSATSAGSAGGRRSMQTGLGTRAPMAARGRRRARNRAAPCASPPGRFAGGRWSRRAIWIGSRRSTPAPCCAAATDRSGASRQRGAHSSLLD